jgi:hypothetical protein
VEIIADVLYEHAKVLTAQEASILLEPSTAMGLDRASIHRLLGSARAQTGSSMESSGGRRSPAAVRDSRCPHRARRTIGLACSWDSACLADVVAASRAGADVRLTEVSVAPVVVRRRDFASCPALHH